MQLRRGAPDADYKLRAATNSPSVIGAQRLADCWSSGNLAKCEGICEVVFLDIGLCAEFL